MRYAAPAFLLFVVLSLALIGVVKVFTEHHPQTSHSTSNLSIILDNRPAIPVVDNPFHGKFVIAIKAVVPSTSVKWNKMTVKGAVFSHPDEPWKLELGSNGKLTTLIYPYVRADNGKADEWSVDLPSYTLIPDKVYVFQMVAVEGKPQQTVASFFFRLQNRELFRAELYDETVIY